MNFSLCYDLIALYKSRIFYLKQSNRNIYSVALTLLIIVVFFLVLTTISTIYGSKEIVKCK